MGNLLTKMKGLTPLIILLFSIAIAAPQGGFKFFSDLGNLEQIEGSATEAKVIPKEEAATFVTIDDSENGQLREENFPSFPALVNEEDREEIQKENHDEVEPSSFVLIDDRELEEPQDSLIPN